MIDDGFYWCNMNVDDRLSLAWRITDWQNVSDQGDIVFGLREEMGRFYRGYCKAAAYAEGMDVAIIDDVSEWQLSLLSKYRVVFDDAASIVGVPQH
jgi:hypothetical protein